jgi:predicted phage tail protein
VCSGTNCAAISGYTLPLGQYTWRVRGTNASGAGDWSASPQFAVYGPPAPALRANIRETADPFEISVQGGEAKAA